MAISLHSSFYFHGRRRNPTSQPARLMHISPSHSRGLAIDKALPHIGTHIVLHRLEKYHPGYRELTSRLHCSEISTSCCSDPTPSHYERRISPTNKAKEVWRILSERCPDFSGGAGGGMPDLAGIQQQMQQNPEVMSQIQMLSMSMMNSPDFLRTMRIQSP